MCLKGLAVDRAGSVLLRHAWWCSTEVVEQAYKLGTVACNFVTKLKMIYYELQTFATV